MAHCLCTRRANDSGRDGGAPATDDGGWRRRALYPTRDGTATTRTTRACDDAMADEDMEALERMMAAMEAKEREAVDDHVTRRFPKMRIAWEANAIEGGADAVVVAGCAPIDVGGCLLYTSPSPRDLSTSRMPSSA